MMLVNVVFSILSMYIKTHTPDICTQYYVDDSKMRAEIHNIDQLKKAIAVNKTFDNLTGQMLSEKSVAWGTSAKSRNAVISIAPPWDPHCL